MKKNHVCEANQICKFCFSPKEKNNHQCPQKFEKLPQFFIRLCFFTFIYDKNENPIMALFYREEEKRGLFKQYIFCDSKLNFDLKNSFSKVNLEASYLNDQWPQKDFKCKFKLSESSFFFQKILSVRTEPTSSFGQQILKFMLDEEYVHTAYICEDSEATKLVRI